MAIRSPLQPRGRPLKGANHRQSITLTLESDFINDLSLRAKELGISRSDYVLKNLPLESSSKFEWPSSYPKNGFNKLVLSEFMGNISKICHKYHIASLALFGSILGPDFRHDSDIDLLVEFETGNIPGLFTIIKIARELSPIFFNREIDLRTPEDLAPEILEAIKNKKEMLYSKWKNETN